MYQKSLLSLSLFFQNTVLVISILFFTSLMHLSFSSKLFPRYEYSSTCFSISSFTVISIFLHFLFCLFSLFYSFLFLNSFHIVQKYPVSSSFCVNPLLLLQQLLSSAYLMVVIDSPPILIPTSSQSASVINISLQRLKSIGESTHPYLTSFAIMMLTVSSLSYLTFTV